jgi:hypothetical protein
MANETLFLNFLRITKRHPQPPTPRRISILMQNPFFAVPIVLSRRANVKATPTRQSSLLLHRGGMYVCICMPCTLAAVTGKSRKDYLAPHDQKTQPNCSAVFGSCVARVGNCMLALALSSKSLTFVTWRALAQPFGQCLRSECDVQHCARFSLRLQQSKHPDLELSKSWCAEQPRCSNAMAPKACAPTRCDESKLHSTRK